MMQLDIRADTLILQGKRLMGILGMFLRLFILSKGGSFGGLFSTGTLLNQLKCSSDVGF